MDVDTDVDDQSTAAGGASSGAEHKPDGGIEAQARRMGWRPETEYRGPKEKWVPADQFVETALTNLPILQDRLRRQDDDLAKRDRHIGDLTRKVDEVTQVLGEFSEHNRTLAERTYARARRELEEEARTAVREGDVEEYDRKQAELAELAKTAPKPVPPKKPEPEPAARTSTAQISPVVQRWVDDPDNVWYHRNARMSSFATAAHGENMRSGMSEADSLEAVKQEVRETFPGYFEKENPARRAPGAVASPSAGGALPPKKKGKTFEDLPADAKKQCDRFVKTIKGFSREKFLADYDWSAPDDEQE